MKETKLRSYKNTQIVITENSLITYKTKNIIEDFEGELKLKKTDKEIIFTLENEDKVKHQATQEYTKYKKQAITKEQTEAINYCLDKEKTSLIVSLNAKNLLVRVNELKSRTITLSDLSDSEKIVSPAQLSFGFEIEFNSEDEDDSEIVNDLNTYFGTTQNVERQKTMTMGTNKISMISNAYDERKDVVKVYHDGSVGCEVVTRPIYLNEMDGVMKKIYQKLNDYDLDFVCDGKAGGHITIMEGQHMDIPMNWNVVSNFIQLSRAFYPQWIALCNADRDFRGVYYYSLNSLSNSRDEQSTDKYRMINKRMKQNKVVGLEIRGFHCPRSPQQAKDNANIALLLYRVAEKITGLGHLAIEQERIDTVKELISEYGSSEDLYDVKSLLSEDQLSTRTFYELLKSEAKQLKLLPLIEKRLFINVELPKINKEELIKEYFSLRLTGKNIKDVLRVVSKKYKVSIKLVDELTNFLE